MKKDGSFRRKEAELSEGSTLAFVRYLACVREVGTSGGMSLLPHTRQLVGS